MTTWGYSAAAVLTFSAWVKNEFTKTNSFSRIVLFFSQFELFYTYALFGVFDSKLWFINHTQKTHTKAKAEAADEYDTHVFFPWAIFFHKQSLFSSEESRLLYIYHLSTS